MNFYRTSAPATLRQHPAYPELVAAFEAEGFQQRGHASRLALAALRVILPPQPEDFWERRYIRDHKIARVIRFYPVTWAGIQRIHEFYGLSNSPEEEATNILRSAVINSMYGKNSYVTPFTTEEVAAIRANAGERTR